MAGPFPTPKKDTVTKGGPWAVGNAGGKDFAVTRRCRHLMGPLDEGSIADGCLVCPWHGATYDVGSGRMLRGPQGIFGKIPGLGFAVKTLTRVLPLGRGTTTRRKDGLHVD